MDDVQQRRIARNEDHCRQANDAIVVTLERFQGAEDHQLSLVCECGVSECRDIVEASLREYLAVRANPIRFMVRPDHAIQQVETVEEQYPGYWVIQKVDAGAEEASRLYEPAND